MNSNKVEWKDLKNRAFIMPVLLIIVGLYDIWHVYDYVINYEDQLIIPNDKIIHIEIENLMTDPEDIGSSSSRMMPQRDFFQAIFMLCLGFMVSLWGLVRFYYFFDFLRIEKKLDALEKKVGGIKER
jgi:hypothetical protein